MNFINYIREPNGMKRKENGPYHNSLSIQKAKTFNFLQLMLNNEQIK
jgi:hypothetical protein